jgi:hypothetical protein
MEIARSFQEAAKSYQQKPGRLAFLRHEHTLQGLKEKGRADDHLPRAVETMGLGGLLAPPPWDGDARGNRCGRAAARLAERHVMLNASTPDPGPNGSCSLVLWGALLAIVVDIFGRWAQLGLDCGPGVARSSVLNQSTILIPNPYSLLPNVRSLYPTGTSRSALGRQLSKPQSEI